MAANSAEEASALLSPREQAILALRQGAAIPDVASSPPTPKVEFGNQPGNLQRSASARYQQSEPFRPTVNVDAPAGKVPRSMSGANANPHSEPYMTFMESPLMKHRMPRNGSWDQVEVPNSSDPDLHNSYVPAPMSRRRYMAYSVGHVLNDMSAACWFSYLLVMLQKARELSPASAGWVMLAGQVADAIATPLVGLASDKSQGCGPFGRRVTWYFFGTLFVMSCFFFVFGICLPCLLHEENELVLILYYSAAASLFNVGWAAVQVSHMALVPELSHDEHVRVSLNSARYFFTITSNVLVFIFLWVFIHALDLSKEKQFTWLAYVTLAVGLGTSIFFMVFTREPPLDKVQVKPEGKKLVLWKDWFFVPGFYQVGWVYMMTRLVVNVSQVFLPFYVLDVLDMHDAFITIVPLLVYLSSFISTVLMKKLNARLGRKRVFGIGVLLCMASVVILFVLEPASAQVIYVPALLLGLGSATIMVTSVQLEADLVGQDIESAAFVYGALSLTDKLSNGIAIFLLQLWNDESPKYIRLATCVIPGAACVAAFAMTAYIDLDQLRPQLNMTEELLNPVEAQEAQRQLEAEEFDQAVDVISSRARPRTLSNSSTGGGRGRTLSGRTISSGSAAGERTSGSRSGSRVGRQKASSRVQIDDRGSDIEDVPEETANDLLSPTANSAYQATNSNSSNSNATQATAASAAAANKANADNAQLYGDGANSSGFDAVSGKGAVHSDGYSRLPAEDDSHSLNSSNANSSNSGSGGSSKSSGSKSRGPSSRNSSRAGTSRGVDSQPRYVSLPGDDQQS